MQVFVKWNNSTKVIEANVNEKLSKVYDSIVDAFQWSHKVSFRLVSNGKPLLLQKTFKDYSFLKEGSTVYVLLRVLGGMDFQNRVGSRPGGGGVASASQAKLDRRERLRQLALETVDLSKDPYFTQNNVGSFECKLCLTLHNNEGNYLAHTQGKRHQTNVARRAIKEAEDAPAIVPSVKQVVVPRKTIKIGRPGYKVVKQRDATNGANSLVFTISYPHAVNGIQPRHRFMSSYEQRIEVADKEYQYLLFACEPYETIGFKIPNQEVDKSEGRFFSNWDKNGKTLTLQLYFKPVKQVTAPEETPVPSRPKLRFH